MNSDDTIRELQRLMYTATVGEDTKGLILLLHTLRDMIDKDHAFALSMAIFVGLECACNQSIREEDRELQLGQMIEMMRLAFARGRAGVAEEGDERE